MDKQAIPLASRKAVNGKKRRDWIFCLCIAIPILAQWLIFYVYSRINSVLSSFQYFNTAHALDPTQPMYLFLPKEDIFRWYKMYFQDLTQDPEIAKYLFNGFLFWLLSYLVGIFSIFIAFAMHKKFPGHKLMTTIMIIPGALSGLVTTLMMKYFIERCIPALAFEFGAVDLSKFQLLLSRPETALGACLAMSTYMAIPGSLLFYLGQFNRIPEELVEYAHMEGIGFFGEFWHLAFPTIYPVWSMGNWGILVAWLNATGPGYALYGLDGYNRGVMTFRYHLQITILGGKDGLYPEHWYPYTATVGVVDSMLSLMSIAIMKRIFDKFDPNREY